jgi:hypothetical protein
MSGSHATRIVKTMTASRAEFERSLAVFDPAACLDDSGMAVVRSAGVEARIQFERLPNQTLGGLLSLPRAQLTIDFDAATTIVDRTAFMQRFDIAFQRGGG